MYSEGAISHMILLRCIRLHPMGTRRKDASSPAPFAGRQTDSSPPNDHSTETAIWCAVAQREPWKSCSVQEICRRDSYHGQVGEDHAYSAGEADIQRARTGSALMRLS